MRLYPVALCKTRPGLYNSHMAKKRTKPVSAADDEAEMIRAGVEDRAFPPSVKGFAIEFGEDSTGDPAVWIWFEVDDDLNPSKEKLSELTGLYRSVTSDILKKLGGSPWPYVGFRVPA